MPITERARRLDASLCAIAPSVKVMSRLSWPESAINAFLHSWRRGEPQVPEVSYSLNGLPTDARRELERIRDEADPDDSVEAYLKATADSYARAVELVSQAGTPAFLELSRMLYGDPYGRLPGTYLTHFEAAQQLLDITAPWDSACRGEDQLSCMTAGHVRDEIQSRLDPFFTEHPIHVVIDPRLTSKAAARVSTRPDRRPRLPAPRHLRLAYRAHPTPVAGRVTLGDVPRLDSAFEDGDLPPGRYITHWAADARRLAAHLSFSLILERIKLENVDLQTILER